MIIHDLFHVFMIIPFQFKHLRWWIKNEIKYNKTNLLMIPPARNVFDKANMEMLPEGIVTSENINYVPLQNLLDHSTKRYLYLCIVICLFFSVIIPILVNK